MWRWLIRVGEAFFWPTFCAAGAGWVALQHQAALWVVALIVVAIFGIVHLTVSSVRSAEIPKPWGFQPRDMDFTKDLKESWDHVPIDDLVREWSGRLPEKKRTTDELPLTKESPPALPFAPREFLIVNPPPCKGTLVGKYVRTSAWTLCLVWSVSAKPDHVRVRWPDGTQGDLDMELIVPACPKKGEWWRQKPCVYCAQPFHEEIIFLDDGGWAAAVRADCGCLTPINYGLGFRRT